MSRLRGLCRSASMKVIAVLWATVLVIGCQTVEAGFQKGIVPENKRIAVEDGNHTARWSTNEVNLDYGYSKNQGSMRLYGEVRYADPIRYNFSLVQYFHMDVIFVDVQGKVLGTAGLVTDSNNPLAPSARTMPVKFDRTLPVPPGTSSIAFSYTGAAREGGGRERGNPTNFWEYPIQ